MKGVSFLNSFVTMVLDGMTNKDPDRIAFASSYSLIENAKPAAPIMAECFRVFSGVKHMGLVFEDHVQNSIFFYAAMDEGGNDTLIYCRIVTKEEEISLLEVNIIRSRGDAGFIFLPEEVENIPDGWTRPIPDGEKASREELEKLASELFTPQMAFDYPMSEDSQMMENGGKVPESLEYLDKMGADTSNLEPAGEGLAYTPAHIIPVRPDQPPKAWVIDEDQGVIGLWCAVDGYVAPYVEPHETSSCFVPDIMIAPHMQTITEEKRQGKKILNQGKATSLTVEFLRYYGGKFHGQHRFSQTQGAGARFPW